MSAPTRRAVLAGALGLGLLSAVSRPAWASVPDDGTGAGDGSAGLAAATLVEDSFTSAAMRGAEVGWAVSYPPGTTVESALPVVLALHGSYGNHLEAFRSFGFQQAQATESTSTPVTVVSVDAEDGFYHPRADGTDTGAMIVDELLPLLAARGLDTGRLGLTGWSMGGYGALLLAATRLRGRVRAVAPISAGLWHRFDEAEPGAFDSAEDFAEHDVFGMRETLAEVPLRVVCGLSDGFRAANEDFVAGFSEVEQARIPESSFQAGGHDGAYWGAVSPSQVAFLSQYLA